MKTTHLLFTYGTLQENAIQLDLFGRILIGIKDVLVGYKISENKYEGIYPVLFQTKNTADIVTGKTYELSTLELEKANAYEGLDYKRVKVTLMSGKKAWVYIGK